MLLAAQYPFVSILGTMLVFFIWVAYVWLMVMLMIDVVRRRDIGGWAKAAWIVLMVVLPWIGVLAYLIIHHEELALRGFGRPDSSDERYSTAGEIERAEGLRDRGSITQAEFEALKSRALTA
ncbi:MAG: hypothetical protein QOE86_3488 [Solirubrobacteraceae bacterium]|jgi:energy-coupling factor transporter transmembrane protein EcfT|nr:hypothetical protein [Solirubrobacteraceae bacterium]